MTERFTCLTLLMLLLVSTSARAQEATIQHGFLFFAGEKYTMDERTYGIYEDGHRFEELIRENSLALEEFRSYESWHTTAYIFTGCSLAAFAFGGLYYMFEKEWSEDLGEQAGIIGFISGGGLLLLGITFEFIAWSSISSAAEIYNKALMDDGLAWQPVPKPSLGLCPGGAQLALTWQF